MEKENNRWLDKSICKHTYFNQYLIRNNFKSSLKFIPRSNNITLNLDKTKQAVSDLLIKNINNESRMNTISVDHDSSVIQSSIIKLLIHREKEIRQFIQRIDCG
jgi:hypothetical protein